MTTVYLVRHGNVEDWDETFHGISFELSERGKRQIQNLATDMKEHGVKPTYIVHSPYLRTWQSAHILLETLDVTHIESDDRIAEWNAGPFFDRPLTEFYAATRYDQTPPRVDDARVEPLEHMAERALASIREHVAKLRGESIMFVSHREPMTTAMLTLQKKSFDTVHQVDFNVATAWKLTFNERDEFEHAEKCFDHHLDT